MSNDRPIPTPKGISQWVRATAPQNLRRHRYRSRISNEISAGGVVIAVQNGQPFTALIARRNRHGYLEWCLPKGHLEENETAEEAALREISEETGIHGRIIYPLDTIDYWFASPRSRIHKVVHHFLVEAISGELTVLNDPDHEAEVAEWVRLDNAAERLAYDNERGIIKNAYTLLVGHA
ncbi:MAG: NUDIX hydrolase [Actinomycetaceae bacterium]|nr:NUDIX hydrolase [Actinomycetaceae bacterium]